MKKILALMLAAAMLMSTAACKKKTDDEDVPGTSMKNGDNSSSDGELGEDGSAGTGSAPDGASATAQNGEAQGDGSENNGNGDGANGGQQGQDGQQEGSNKPVIDESMNDSKTLEMFRVLSGDEYIMDANFMGAKMMLCRKGDDLFTNIDMLGMAKGTTLIVNGTIYLHDQHDRETKTPRAVKKESKANRDKIEELFNWFKENMMGIEGAVMVKSGTATFQGEKNVYFEEVESSGDDTVRYFFNKDDELIGTEINGHQMDLFISGNVPEGTFDIPKEFDGVSDANFDKIFNNIFL